MKRSLYDSEYEKVRREAGLKNNGRLRPEFPDDFDPIAPPLRAMPADIVHDEEFKQRMDARSAHETEQAAKRRVESERYTREVNARMARREYEVLGLTPPEPFVSLALLKSLGWKVEHFEIGGQERWELMRPASVPAPRQSEGA